MRLQTGDIEIEVVSAPFVELGVLAFGVKVQVDADEVATVLDCGVLELQSGFDLAVVLVVVLVVCNDRNSLVEVGLLKASYDVADAAAV